MADLTITNAVTNSSVTPNVNNGAASQTIVIGKSERMVIRVTNTDATAARIRVKAGDGISSANGDVYVDLTQNAVTYIGPLESAQFGSKSTGKITVQITGTNDAAFGGVITNVKIEVAQL
jgi:hypothetical protein